MKDLTVICEIASTVDPVRANQLLEAGWWLLTACTVDGLPAFTLGRSANMGFGGTVEEAGGGTVTILVDRDTPNYPPLGAHVWCEAGVVLEPF